MPQPPTSSRHLQRRIREIAYSYNLLNRLTHVAATTASNALAGYTYTLGAAGNRTGVAELSGRRVTYGYDDIYRLTSETIAGAAQQNGTIGYVYSPVGNRKTLTSTVAAIPAGVMNYDANDRISTDASDSNGNNLGAGGIENVYDFENHLVQRGGVTIVYDGDGNRLAAVEPRFTQRAYHASRAEGYATPRVHGGTGR